MILIRPKRLIILIVFISFSLINISALDLGVEGGISTFNYCELSENLKEDLYTFNSGIAGIKAKQKLSKFELVGFIGAQLPFEALFTDLYGQDTTNYLISFFYFGINSKIGLYYPIIDKGVKLSVGIFINYDFFYLKNMSFDLFGDEVIFSVLGNGIELDFEIPMTNKLTLGLSGSFSLNYLPLYERGGSLKWSNNINIGGYCTYNIF